MHISDPEQRAWIQERIEGTGKEVRFTEQGKKAILNKLIEAELFERFIDVKYTGTKRFGLDGSESIIPALEQIIKRGGQLGVREIVIGMPHRGRLNFLSNVKPPQQVVTMKPMADQMQVWAGTHNKTPKQMAKIITGDWSANRLFPKDQIIAKYLRRMWFSSSISWLIALAMEEQATDIGLWGIDLESGEEYISQFVGCVHLLDLAQHKGINIHLPKDCGLLRDPAPYPDCYETHFALVTEKKTAWLRHNLQIGENEHATTQAELHRKEGELLTLRSQKTTGEVIQKCEGELVAANQKMGQLAAQINQLRGELSTLDYLRRMYVMGMKQPEDPGWAL
ncbi:hypothetical protein LCGC14_0905060 [marine sediment metagenome]|uniref:Dehydrogenase E1 component domain-containing protein n=1 Tax=marine sediment metagenome TaxID=412755 RepID=A0A0F9NZX4_9ZZZZ